MKKLLFSALSVVFSISMAHAVKAYHGLLKKQLPDGSCIEIRQNGDETFHYTTLADGTLVIELNDGFFYYATIGKDRIEPTEYKVGQKIPANIRMANNTTADAANSLASLRKQRFEARKNRQRIRTKSPEDLAAERGLVILVNFTDKQFTYDAEMFKNVLNQPGYNGEYATGSAFDYFSDSSYEKYTPTFDVLGPYDLSHDVQYYGGNDWRGDDRRATNMIVEACKLAEADGQDLSIYDSDGDGFLDYVYVFYAGEGEANGGSEDTIWPHRYEVIPTDSEEASNGGYTYSGKMEDTKVCGVYVHDYACSNEICADYEAKIGSSFDGVGTFIHEFGHVLGFPDFYVTDYSSNHWTLDVYDVMDHASYLNYSRTPVSYSGYERMFMNWLVPEQLYPSYEGTRVELPVIEEGKVYLLTDDGSEHNLDARHPDPSKFYLIENKSNTGWDKYADPSAYSLDYSTVGDLGMLITQINYNEMRWEYNTVNNNERNMGVSYVCNSNQKRTTSFYPMFPGKRNVTSIEFGNYTISDIRQDELTGVISFIISDKTAEPSGISNGTLPTPAFATSDNGKIKISGDFLQVRIANMQGATIFNGTDNEISLPEGIYIVQIKDANGTTSTQKIPVR